MADAGALDTVAEDQEAGARIFPIRALHPHRQIRRVTRKPIGGASKRAMDVLLSGAALLVLAFPLALVAVAIKAETPGPALFLQRRGGFKGRPFLIFKFRTMTSSDDGNVIAQAVSDDSRVTRLGAFLRKTSIDELPQLINVLSGEMSLVGPRPHAVAHDRAFKGADPRYGRRFRARPGVTGLAQVCGCRGETKDAADVRARVDHDLRYIASWSLLLDCWIILRTALMVMGVRADFGRDKGK